MSFPTDAVAPPPAYPFNKEGFYKYGDEPEKKAMVAGADVDRWGMCWELACSYSQARDAGATPGQAALEACMEWDLCVFVDPGLMVPPSYQVGAVFEEGMRPGTIVQDDNEPGRPFKLVVDSDGEGGGGVISTSPSIEAALAAARLLKVSLSP